MKVSPIQQYHYETPPYAPVEKEKRTAFQELSINTYYQGLTDEERKEIITQYHNGRLVDRIYIQDYLLEGSPDYIKNDTQEVQRRFLGQQFNCNCSDCDGPDTTSACLVECAFYEKTGIETPDELVIRRSSQNTTPVSPLSLSIASCDSVPTSAEADDYEEPDSLSLEERSVSIKSRVSLTYEDIKKMLETEVNL